MKTISHICLYVVKLTVYTRMKFHTDLRIWSKVLKCDMYYQLMHCRTVHNCIHTCYIYILLLLIYSYSEYIKYNFNISQKSANNNKQRREGKMIEPNELNSATIICLKATTHKQADQHVQFTECLKSNIIKLLASAQRVNHRRYICHIKVVARPCNSTSWVELSWVGWDRIRSVAVMIVPLFIGWRRGECNHPYVFFWQHIFPHGFLGITSVYLWACHFCECWCPYGVIRPTTTSRSQLLGDIETKF